jgi:hypothetical protein
MASICDAMGGVERESDDQISSIATVCLSALKYPSVRRVAVP